MKPAPEWVGREAQLLVEQDAHRRLTTVRGPTGPRVLVDGRQVLNFSSNDYLGLAADSRLVEAAAACAGAWGVGSGASRLITGTLGIHEQLEARAAALKGTETALLFASGYQANIGVLTALMREGSIFSDELNHASIVDGCRLARAHVLVYRHADPAHLAYLLQTHRQAPRKLIVTDGVFSMDGDLAPLAEIVGLAEEYDALVLVDDAHATGALGDGRGAAHFLGVHDQVDVHMGTLGKALGSFGAFVACSEAVRDLLVNRARSFIYSTALPPPAVGAALAALCILEDEPERLRRLHDNVRALRAGLRAAEFMVSGDPTPIVPLVLGSNERALRWSEQLWQEGLWVHPIRPPSVPPGTARLRITVSAGHTEDDIATLLAGLGRLAEEEGPR